MANHRVAVIFSEAEAELIARIQAHLSRMNNRPATVAGALRWAVLKTGAKLPPADSPQA